MGEKGMAAAWWVPRGRRLWIAQSCCPRTGEATMNNAKNSSDCSDEKTASTESVKTRSDTGMERIACGHLWGRVLIWNACKHKVIGKSGNEQEKAEANQNER